MAANPNSQQVRADGLAEVLSSVGGRGSGSSSPMMVFRNPVSGYGTARDRLAYSVLNDPQLLSREDLDALYMHWICRRVVDHVADEITRAGWVVQMGLDSNAQKVPGVDVSMRDLAAEATFNEGIKAARQYGGSCIVMYLDDGRDQDQPVDWDNLKAVTGLEPIDRWYLVPDITPETVRYSKPMHYELQMLDQLNTGPTKIHHERILRFEGRRLPFRIQQLNQGWGMSELQPILESVSRYTQSLGDLQQILGDLDVFTHKIKGLATMLASGKEKQVKDRLAVNDLSRSQYRGFAIDADKEEIEFQSRNCSGLAEVIESLKADLVGATGFPATLLFGDSPKGMASTGRSEERDFSRTVEAYRDSIVRKPLAQLAYALMKSKSGPTQGRVPKDWTVSFPSLFVMNEREIADLKARVAASDYRYWVMGALTSSEVAMSRFAGAEYSLETTLDMSQREADGTLQEEKIAELLRIQGKQDPRMIEQTGRVNGPPGIRGLSKTGERSDPTNNEQGSLNYEGQKSIGSENIGDED
jgi:phage-related protein (TIGR01555 family)